MQNVHNYCDIIGTYTTGLYFYQDLRNRYPNYTQSFVVIDDSTTAIRGTDKMRHHTTLSVREHASFPCSEELEYIF